MDGVLTAHDLGGPFLTGLKQRRYAFACPPGPDRPFPDLVCASCGGEGAHGVGRHGLLRCRKCKGTGAPSAGAEDLYAAAIAQARRPT